MSAPTLKAARRAVWVVVDDFDALSDRLKTTIRFDSGIEKRPGATRIDWPEPTSPSQCPCLRIEPAQTAETHVGSQVNEYAYTLNATIFTAGWDYSESEDLWELLFAAIHAGTAPGGSTPHIASVCGRPPVVGRSQVVRRKFANGPTTSTNASDGPNMLQHTIPITLLLRNSKG